MKHFGLLLLALLIGYGPEWAPYYVKAFFPGDLKVHGPISRYAVSCAETTANSACTHRYLIPREIWAPGPESTHLGMGTIISASRVKCANGASAHALEFDDYRNPGKLFDTLLSYQVADIRQLECDGDLEVQAWSRPSARRKGLVNGQLVSGSAEAVGRVKRLSEFFTVDLLMVLTFGFIALYALSSMLHRLLSGVARRSPFETTLWAWLGFILANSGALQIVIPLTRYPQLFIRV